MNAATYALGRRVYFAARYSRHPELRAYRAALARLGHEVTSRWIDQHGGALPVSIPASRLNAAPGEYARYALADMEDIARADLLVAFTEAGGGDGGDRHVEVGVALGLGKQVVLVGPRENVFHTLPDVQVFRRWIDLLAWLDPR